MCVVVKVISESSRIWHNLLVLAGNFPSNTPNEEEDNMTTRREFLKRSAIIAAATPSILSRGYVRAEDINSRPTVASIGVGGSRGLHNRGGHIGRAAAKLGQMIAVCDVDQRHNEEFNEAMGGKLGMYTDYRKLFDKERPDVVTIGTPDHWHVPIAIAALRAGSDVYCEKPLTLTIDEGIAINKVVKETGRVFQVGTQQRSEMGQKFLQAIALVQGGRLGKHVNAYVAIGSAPGEGPFETTDVPDGLDWDMWVGPAPAVDYCVERRKIFRWWYEYSGGKMTDWGAHHIDIAQWAMGHSETGPVSVRGNGEFGNVVPTGVNWGAFLNGESQLPNGFNAATTFSIDLKFADDTIINVNDTFERESDGTKFENGILFEGELGRVFVSRGKITGKIIEDLSEDDWANLAKTGIELCKGKKPGSHMGNFFECVEDRSLPISDVFSHHRTMTSCHLCNLAIMLGRELKWDPTNETFLGDDEANALKTRKSRETYLVS